jgi:tetratricopeptide (TPR) repeat protein
MTRDRLSRPPERVRSEVLRSVAMRLLTALGIVGLSAMLSAGADPLAEARRLYNLGQYENAAKMAREATKVSSTAESARLVLGRVYLERYRQSAEPEELTQAVEALRMVNPQGLDPRERAELIIGQGEALYLADYFGAAVELFERALDSGEPLGASQRERLLDWWATAVDRLALTHPRDAREPAYTRIMSRMEKELAADSASAPASYWLAAAARGAGNLDRAWNAAQAGWVSAPLGRDQGAALRADLDRLMVQGIIPDRALRLQPRDTKQAAATMLAEWEALKASWTR